MNESKICDKLSSIYTKRGFTSIQIDPIIPELGWSFDFFAESENETVAIEIRKNDKIPDVFIERIEKIKKHSKKLSIYVLFDKQPRSSVLSLLERQKIGVILFQKNNIYYLIPSKDFSRLPKIKKKKRKIEKKPKAMYQIYVFVSSKQYENNGESVLKERKSICKIIKKLNKVHEIPVYAHLVENDPQEDRKFKIKITKNIKKCHIFVCALQDKYSDYVKYEIEKTFKIFPDKKCILIFKKDMKPDIIENKQKQLIKYVEKHTSHLPYSGIRDFEEKLERNLVPIIGFLYKKNGCNSPFDW